MTTNNLEKFRAKLAAGKFCLGASVSVADASVTELACEAGFDFVFIDGEHGDIDRKTAMEHIMAVNGSDAASFYRVPNSTHVEIKRVIDFAPAAIVVPMVMDAESARRAIAAMRYPPVGDRGCGFRRGNRYGAMELDRYWDISRHDPWVVLQIEHIAAYRELDRILALEGLDSIMIGPFDFSASMGKAGQWDDPEVCQVFDAACRRIRDAGVVLGCSLDVRQKEWKDRGVQYMQVKGDLPALFERWKAVIAESATW